MVNLIVDGVIQHCINIETRNMIAAAVMFDNPKATHCYLSDGTLCIYTK